MRVKDLIEELLRLDPDLRVYVLEDNQVGDTQADITGVQEWDGIACIEINAGIDQTEETHP
jgi:hypothetical protein